jgi:hypothetical protein
MILRGLLSVIASLLIALPIHVAQVSAFPAPTNAPVDYETVSDENRAIALIVVSPNAISLARQLRGSVQWTANADIVWRRSMEMQTYCPHQVYVFAEEIVPSGVGRTWRWIANVGTGQIAGPLALSQPKIDRVTGRVGAGQVLDSKTCIGGIRPKSL